MQVNLTLDNENEADDFVLSKIFETKGDPITELANTINKLSEEKEGLETIFEYWSVCTWEGMLKRCPEKKFELLELFKSLGIKHEFMDV